MADKVTVDLDVSMDAKAKDPDDVGNVNSANSEAESGSKSSGMDWKSLGGSEEKESSTVYIDMGTALWPLWYVLDLMTDPLVKGKLDLSKSGFFLTHDTHPGRQRTVTCAFTS